MGKKVRSGFCGAGQCEGTEPVSYSGIPMKTCQSWMTCSCDCHIAVTKMFEMTGLERIPVENPHYHPVKSPYWMPSPEDRVADLRASNGSGAVAPIVLESRDPGRAPARVVPSYGTTPSGRAARGQLESWVQEACDEFLVEAPEAKCTPDWISNKIYALQGVEPPSVGAIHAVLMRWQTLEFAYVEKKPVRFLGYTPQGIQMGLDGLKAQAKRQKKMREMAGRRGERS